MTSDEKVYVRLNSIDPADTVESALAELKQERNEFALALDDIQELADQFGQLLPDDLEEAIGDLRALECALAAIERVATDARFGKD